MTDTVSFGYEDVAPDEKTARVGGVFASVASSYDLMNDAMSGGHAPPVEGPLRPPREAARGRADPRHGRRHRRHRVPPGQIGRERHRRRYQPGDARGRHRARARSAGSTAWSGSEANAETLQFPDHFFDAYTIAFGIRNVTDIPQALREAHRVLKRGGRFFCLEFSTTLWPGFADVYDAYSHRIVPKVGKLIAGDEESYRYLIESIRRFPTMDRFKAMIGEAGFVQTKVEPMLGGLVAIHSGWKI